jgi:hypothetical protein
VKRLVILAVAMLLPCLSYAQCGPRGCAPGGGGLPQMPFFMPTFPQPVYAPPVIVSPPIGTPVNVDTRTDGLTPAQIDAGKSDWDKYPTFHYGPDTSMVWLNGQLVPNREPTHVSYPGGPMQPYVQGKQYPPLKASPYASGAAPPPAAPAPKCPACQDPTCKCGCLNGARCTCKPAGVSVQTTPNATPTDNALPGEPPVLNFGRDLSKTNPQGCSPNTLCGKPITKERAYELLREGSELPDDSKAYRLTAIGKPEDTAAIVRDVASSPDFADLRSHFTFQAYTPDDPMISDLGFAPGSPSVYLQQPDGKVLARWESYTPDSVAGEIRKRKPDYDPSKDPNPLKKPTLPSVPDSLKNIPLPWFIAAVAALGFIFVKK